MKLNHANIFASDVHAMSDVFAKHFSFTIENRGDAFAMLRGSDGFSLVIMSMAEGVKYPKAKAFGMEVNTHLGFVLGLSAEVYAKHSELRNGGCQPGEIKTFEAVGKKWTAFYCPVGDGIDIEVAANEEISN